MIRTLDESAFCPKNNWRNLVSSLTESFLVKYKYHRSSIYCCFEAFRFSESAILLTVYNDMLSCSQLEVENFMLCIY